MANEKWLISICAGWQQKQSLLNAKSLGINVIAFDADINAPCRSIVDLFFPIDICNSVEIIKKIEQIGIVPIAVVSFISDLGMKSAGIVNDYFKTGGMSEKLANKLTNKKLQRQCWESLGVFNPNWVSIDDLTGSKFKAIVNQFAEKEVMIKPIDSAGSRGIHKIKNLNMNDMQILKESIRSSLTGEIIIEEYIDGREFSIESFWDKGVCEILAISERFVLNDRTATSIISIKLPSELENIIKDANIKANLALGVQFGLTHTELILDKENRPFLLETAGRGGGFYVFDGLVPKVSGIDYSKVFIEQLTKQKPSNHQIGKKKLAAIRYIPSQEGIIKSISGFEIVNKIKGINAGCFVKKGDLTKACYSDADRLGYVLAWGESKKELEQLFMQASSLIEINYY